MTFLRWLVWAWIGAVVLGACGGEAGDSNTPIPAPTRTLIPSTATPTGQPVLTSPTPTDLPSPATLAAATETAGLSTAPLERMITLTTEDLVAQGIDPDDIRIVSIDAVTWADDTWECASQKAPNAGGSQRLMPGYRIVYSVRNRATVYHTDRRETFFACEDDGWLLREGTPLLIDPIVASMVALCKQDAARRLAVDESAFELGSVVMLTWPDESIGCPRPGITYDDSDTPGYRIVLRTGETEMVYHTSVRHVVLCEPDDEILPGMIRQGLATPAPDSRD